MRTTKIARLIPIRGEIFQEIVSSTFGQVAKKYGVSRGTLDALATRYPKEYAAILVKWGKKAKRHPRNAVLPKVLAAAGSLHGPRPLLALPEPHKAPPLAIKAAAATPGLSTPTTPSPLAVSGPQLTFAEVLKELAPLCHPAADLYPLVDDKQFSDLCASVQTQGLLTKIVRCAGKFLDGRRRFTACRLTGTPLRFEDVPEPVDPYGYVIDAHQDRRYLGKSSLACCAVLALSHYEEAAVKRQKLGLKRGAEAPVGLDLDQRATAGRSADLVARRFGVSRAQVNLANGLYKSDRSMFTRVHKGEISLSAALRECGAPSTPKSSTPRAVKDSPSRELVQQVLALIKARRKESRQSIDASQKLIAEIQDLMRKLG
jgi:hypothetical protein